MSIRIVDDEVIELPRAKHRKFQREWAQACQYHVNPPDFESFVKARLYKNDGSGEPAYQKYHAKAVASGEKL